MPVCRVPFNAMGTLCQIQLVAESQAQAELLSLPAVNEVKRLESKYTRYRDTSLLSQINAAAGSKSVSLDDEAVSLFLYASNAYEQSAGLFDITSGVLRQAWDFKSPSVPDQAVVDALLSRVGWSSVAWDGGSKIMLPAGFEVDFGGFVKEYAADAAAAILKAGGVSAALVDLGGDVSAFGRSWSIGLKNPASPDARVATVSLESGALATSGNYERCFVYKGQRYSHILNPLTGWPVVTPASVSVMAESALIAGTVSTVAMLSGESGCLAWLDEIALPYVCAFNDGKLVNTL